MDIATSQPGSSLSCTRPLGWPSHDSLESENQCVILLSLCRCVSVSSLCERETRERDRGSFGNLKIGGGAGPATWTMCCISNLPFLLLECV